MYCTLLFHSAVKNIFDFVMHTAVLKYKRRGEKYVDR